MEQTNSIVIAVRLPRQAVNEIDTLVKQGRGMNRSEMVRQFIQSQLREASV